MPLSKPRTHHVWPSSRIQFPYHSRCILQPERAAMSKLSERDVCSKFITPALISAGLEPANPDPRGSQLHQGPHHRARQAAQPGQGQARGLRAVPQAQPADRPNRSQGPDPRRRCWHAAAPRLRRNKNESRIIGSLRTSSKSTV